MEKMIEALKAELEMRQAEYRQAAKRAADVVADYSGKPGYSTHFGHNLASVATDLSVIAGRIEAIHSTLRFAESLK